MNAHTLTHSHTHTLTRSHSFILLRLRFWLSSLKTAPDSYAVRAKRAYSYSLTLLKIAPSYMNAHTLTPVNSVNPVNSFNPVNPFKHPSRLVRVVLSGPRCLIWSALFDLVRIVRLVCVHLVSSASISSHLRCSSCPRCLIWSALFVSPASVSYVSSRLRPSRLVRVV